MWLNGGSVPEWIADDYNDLELCKLYHCTPAELDAQDHARIERHMAIESALRKYARLDEDTRR